MLRAPIGCQAVSLPGVIVGDRLSQLLSVLLDVVSCVDHGSFCHAQLADGVRRRRRRQNASIVQIRSTSSID